MSEETWGAVAEPGFVLVAMAYVLWKAGNK